MLCEYNAQIAISDAQITTGGYHGRRDRLCVVLGTRSDDLATLHRSEQLDGRRPREASVAFSPRSAGMGQQSTSVRLPALDASRVNGSAGCSVPRLGWKCRLVSATTPTWAGIHLAQQGGCT